jgi:trimeric autotransporter adhesin
MRTLLISAAALVMASQVHAQSIPEAPSLTAGGEFKGLRFDWQPVAGASWYDLEYKAHQNSAFSKLGSNLPGSATSFRYRFPLHLFDWTYARYRLAACNASGCTRSAEISVSNLRLDAVGYFKAPVSTAGLAFGSDTDITPDGLNFVAAASGEVTDSSGFKSGAVYVYRRSSNGVWSQRARLVPPVAPVHTGDENKMNVSISADGNTVVLGMPNYFREALAEGASDDISGEVFVFHFNGTSWVRSRLYGASGARGSFGAWVSINDAGDLIALGSGEYTPEQKPRHAYIYRKVGDAWQGVRGIQAVPGREYCDYGALSADGSTLVQNCRRPTEDGLRNYVRAYSGPNWTIREEMPLEIPASPDIGVYSVGIAVDRTGSTIAAQVYVDEHGGDGPAEVHVFHRDGAYSRVAILQPGAWNPVDYRSSFGLSVAISDDGGTIAVGHPSDTGYGKGPRAAPLNPGGPVVGAVYVYRLKNNWLLANMVKPNYLPETREFGRQVALNGNGQTLLVGHGYENSAAQGIDGNWANTGAPYSGAVWLY